MNNNFDEEMDALTFLELNPITSYNNLSCDQRGMLSYMENHIKNLKKYIEKYYNAVLEYLDFCYKEADSQDLEKFLYVYENCEMNYRLVSEYYYCWFADTEYTKSPLNNLYYINEIDNTIFDSVVRNISNGNIKQSMVKYQKLYTIYTEPYIISDILKLDIKNEQLNNCIYGCYDDCDHCHINPRLSLQEYIKNTDNSGNDTLIKNTIDEIILKLEVLINDFYYHIFHYSYQDSDKYMSYNAVVKHIIDASIIYDNIRYIIDKYFYDGSPLLNYIDFDKIDNDNNYSDYEHDDDTDERKIAYSKLRQFYKIYLEKDKTKFYQLLVDSATSSDVIKYINKKEGILYGYIRK